MSTTVDGCVEPIAVLGVGCRFPGHADSPESFWRLLCDGVDAISECSPQRVEQSVQCNSDWPGADAVRERMRLGGFLENIDQFDAAFFRISPREAMRMDPQQRLLLEVAWEALEDAGQVTQRLAGSATGVFVGISSFDYGAVQLGEGPQQSDDPYAGTGSALSIAANRISYVFDFRGPSMAVDTACSSSLTAAHVACQNLRAGECDLALAGGVNLILSFVVSAAFGRSGFLAPDGRCKAFDSRANGYVRGEGCGVVVLKRLKDALAARDPIRAVIRGSAVNQDGRSNGLTAPNRFSQISVIQAAYRASGVDPGLVQYVEAHGTGTALGDPIEAAALGTVFSVPSRREPCAIGSVKTNIGHLEAAAGIAGLIKTVLSIEQAEIPPSLHYQNPNPQIHFDELRLRVSQKLEPWPDGGVENHRRLAGVSAFGFGGTNVHMVLENAPEPGCCTDVNGDTGARVRVLPISARGVQSLRALAEAYEAKLRSSSPASDICYTAAVRRTHHREHRLAVVGRSPEELAAELARISDSAAGVTIAGKPSAVVFVFAGQGTQYPGMAKELLASEPVFRSAVDRCDAALEHLLGWSVRDALGAGGEDVALDSTDVGQLLVFTVQVALAAMWRAWGIEPKAVVGHSLGEIAAAHVAGALDLTDAALIIARRSSLMRRLEGRGRMLAVSVPAAAAEAALSEAAVQDRVAVAAINAPELTVLAGDTGALTTLAASLEARGVRCTWLPVWYAFHGPEMASLCDELERSLAGVIAQVPAVPWFSTVTGTRVSDTCRPDAGHWARAIASPVRFLQAMNAIGELLPPGSEPVFLEVGPRPVLVGAVAAIRRDAITVASLKPGQNDRATLLRSLAELYQRGSSIDWPAVYPEGRTTSVPTYRWQRSSYWLNSDPLETDSPTRCLYKPEWRPVPRQNERGQECAASDSSRWLIVADRGQEGTSLARTLGAQGAECVVVQPGSGNDYQDVFRHLSESRASRLRGVIHFRSLDAVPYESLTPKSLASAQDLGCVDVLHLLRELAYHYRSNPFPLWLITRGAQSIGEGGCVPGVAQSPLWGFGRVIAEEHPEFWGGLIDLDPAAKCGASASLIADEIQHPALDDQIAFREGRRYVARLVCASESTPRPATPAWRRDRSYVITGGTGEIGLRIARWMAEGGARRIVLLGRMELPPRTEWRRLDCPSRVAGAIGAIREIESLGASVHVAPVDVAEDELKLFLASFVAEGWPPIAGVVHAAGVADERLVNQLTSESLMSVLRPKVLGGWQLHEQFRDEPLDFFVLCSSAASLIGTPGQAAYAAANAFLDSLAHCRRALGLPAVAINWGMWSDVGLSATPAGNQLRTYLAGRGVEPIETAQALALLGPLIGQKSPQMAALAVDWAKFHSAYPVERQPRLTASLVEGPAQDSTTAAPAYRPTTRRQLSEVVREHLAHVLALDGVGHPLQQPFEALGLDSITALELRSRLESSLGVSLPATLAWNFPTADALTDYLCDRMKLFEVAEAGGISKTVEFGGQEQQVETALRDLAHLTSTMSESEFGRLLGHDG